MNTGVGWEDPEEEFLSSLESGNVFDDVGKDELDMLAMQLMWIVFQAGKDPSPAQRNLIFTMPMPAPGLEEICRN